MDHGKNIVRASMAGVLARYAEAERQRKEARAVALRAKRQTTGPKLSARQQRKADKARRRAQRLVRDAFNSADTTLTP